MMRTWSIASCIDRVTITVVDAQAFAAVAVQGLIDAAHTVERMSRPVRRDEDYEAVSPDGYYGYAEPNLGGADWLADKEAEEEVGEPAISCPNCGATTHLGVSGVWPESIIRCYHCSTISTVHHHPQGWTDVRAGHLGPYHAGGERFAGTPRLCDGCVRDNCAEVCPYLPDDIPNPTEPSLSDDELIGVRGLLQARYGGATVDPQSPPTCSCGLGMRWSTALSAWLHTIDNTPVCADQSAKADRLDAEMWRAYVRSQSTPAASAAGSSPSVDDGHSPVPPTEGRSTWSDLADRMVEHLPSAKVQDGIDSAASTFPQHTRKHLK